MVRGDVAVVAFVKCENPWALPPFPTWGGVLATKTRDPGIMDGWDNVGEAPKGVTRSIVECAGTVSFCTPKLIPKV